MFIKKAVFCFGFLCVFGSQSCANKKHAAGGEAVSAGSADAAASAPNQGSNLGSNEGSDKKDAASVALGLAVTSIDNTLSAADEAKAHGWTITPDIAQWLDKLRQTKIDLLDPQTVVNLRAMKDTAGERIVAIYQDLAKRALDNYDVLAEKAASTAKNSLSKVDEAALQQAAATYCSYVVWAGDDNYRSCYVEILATGTNARELDGSNTAKPNSASRVLKAKTKAFIQNNPMAVITSGTVSVLVGLGLFTYASKKYYSAWTGSETQLGIGKPLKSEMVFTFGDTFQTQTVEEAERFTLVSAQTNNPTAKELLNASMLEKSNFEMEKAERDFVALKQREPGEKLSSDGLKYQAAMLATRDQVKALIELQKLEKSQSSGAELSPQDKLTLSVAKVRLEAATAAVAVSEVNLQALTNDKLLPQAIELQKVYEAVLVKFKMITGFAQTDRFLTELQKNDLADAELNIARARGKLVNLSYISMPVDPAMEASVTTAQKEPISETSNLTKLKTTLTSTPKAAVAAVGGVVFVAAGGALISAGANALNLSDGTETETVDNAALTFAVQSRLIGATLAAMQFMQQP